MSEAIEPVGVSFDAARMANAEPGLPREFVWRGQTFEISAVLRSWRDTGPCRHGSAERYVRKHWFEVVTRQGPSMRLYCDRHPRGGRQTARWWLFSIADDQ